MSAETSDVAASRVVHWRCSQLARVGFTVPVAARIASDERYDVHALLELVDRGCPPELAARILAPLETDGRSA